MGPVAAAAVAAVAVAAVGAVLAASAGSLGLEMAAREAAEARGIRAAEDLSVSAAPGRLEIRNDGPLPATVVAVGSGGRLAPANLTVPALGRASLEGEYPGAVVVTSMGNSFAAGQGAARAGGSGAQAGVFYHDVRGTVVLDGGPGGGREAPARPRVDAGGATFAALLREGAEPRYLAVPSLDASYEYAGGSLRKAHGGPSALNYTWHAAAAGAAPPAAGAHHARLGGGVTILGLAPGLSGRTLLLSGTAPPGAVFETATSPYDLAALPRAGGGFEVLREATRADLLPHLSLDAAVGAGSRVWASVEYADGGAARAVRPLLSYGGHYRTVTGAEAPAAAPLRPGPADLAVYDAAPLRVHDRVRVLEAEPSSETVPDLAPAFDGSGRTAAALARGTSHVIDLGTLEERRAAGAAVSGSGHGGAVVCACEDAGGLCGAPGGACSFVRTRGPRDAAGEPGRAWQFRYVMVQGFYGSGFKLHELDVEPAPATLPSRAGPAAGGRAYFEAEVPVPEGRAYLVARVPPGGAELRADDPSSRAGRLEVHGLPPHTAYRLEAPGRPAAAGGTGPDGRVSLPAAAPPGPAPPSPGGTLELHEGALSRAGPAGGLVIDALNNATARGAPGGQLYLPHAYVRWAFPSGAAVSGAAAGAAPLPYLDGAYPPGAAARVPVLPGMREASAEVDGAPSVVRLDSLDAPALVRHHPAGSAAGGGHSAGPGPARAAAEVVAASTAVAPRAGTAYVSAEVHGAFGASSIEAGYRYSGEMSESRRCSLERWGTTSLKCRYYTRYLPDPSAIAAINSQAASHAAGVERALAGGRLASLEVSVEAYRNLELVAAPTARLSGADSALAGSGYELDLAEGGASFSQDPGRHAAGYEARVSHEPAPASASAEFEVEAGDTVEVVVTVRAAAEAPAPPPHHAAERSARASASAGHGGVLVEAGVS